MVFLLHTKSIKRFLIRNWIHCNSQYSFPIDSLSSAVQLELEWYTTSQFTTTLDIEFTLF